jgi:hypothetical protein
MFKPALAAVAFVCVITIGAEARPVATSCVWSLFMPPCPKEIGLHANNVKHLRAKRASKEITPSYGAPSPSFGYNIGRPGRYIAGRLICALNANAALAERGIKGTGSALAHSFDHWGVRVPNPVVGAVAVTDRRGGGHVAIVSRVEGSRVFVWNPAPRGRGWQEREYTSRHARYRVAG